MKRNSLPAICNLAIIPATLLTLSVPCHAVLIAYDGFDVTQYVAGGGYAKPVYGDSSSSNALVFDPQIGNPSGDETGQNPPTFGFSGQWTNSNPIANFVYAKLQNSQLSYTGLNTTVGQVAIVRDSSTTSVKSFDRTISTGTSASYGTALYIAGIIQPSASTAFGMTFTYGLGDDRTFQFDVDAAGTTSLTSSFGPAATTADNLWTANAVNFFVLKLENGILSGSTANPAGDQMSLYINPDLSAEGLNSPVLQYGDAGAQFFVTGNSDYAITNMRLSAAPGAGSAVTFDELKIATTWADLSEVAVVPEPSTTLLGLVGIALLFRRKR